MHSRNDSNFLQRPITNSAHIVFLLYIIQQKKLSFLSKDVKKLNEEN